MLLQFHWQQRTEPYRTEFVEQSFDIETEADFQRWNDHIVEKHWHEAEQKAKEGWLPMVCTQEAPEFVREAEPTIVTT